MTRLFSLAAVITSAVWLAACGFTPLYAISGVSPGLSSIQVHVPDGRTGFLLGEDLDDAFARNRDAPPVYRLDVTLLERSFARGLNVSSAPKYFENQLTVHYQLIEIATGKVLKTGEQPVEVSYAAADQPYAGVSAYEDAQKRSASQAAQQIRIDLAGYFAKRTAP
jgi:LPS-assembly lipoprotein